MSLNYSTEFRNRILGLPGTDANASGMRGIFNGFFIDLYSGSQPANADQAPTGTLLVTISVNAGGGGSPLHFGSPIGGVISKASAETYKGLGVAAGTVGWFRLRLAGDSGTTQTTVDPRIDGSCAVSGGDLALSNTTIAVGTPITIDTFTLTATFQ